MKTLGIVILYYPNINIEENIASYIDSLDKLIIWNNTPKEASGSCVTIKSSWEDKIILMGLGKNVGIGKALNEGVRYASENNYTFLLTMDQDSCFVKDDFDRYLDIIKKANIKSIFSPNYVIHGKEWYTSMSDFIEVETTMTSGSIYPVYLFSEIGSFRDDFFIDAIDTEFSLRAKKFGITTRVIPNTYLIHGAGYQKTKYKFLWKTFFPNEYSPVRSYYIVRNGIITKHLYPWANWKGFLYYWFYKRLFFVICYEDNKFAKIKGLLYGFYHGMIGKTGEQTIFK